MLLPRIIKADDILKSSLTMEQKETVLRVLSYYSTILHAELRATISDIAIILNKTVPCFQMIAGVGFPFYGDVDPRLRITKDFKQIGTTKTPAEFIRKILPDIDLLVVYDSEEGPYAFSKTMLSGINNSFSTAIGYDKMFYRKALQAIKEKHPQYYRDERDEDFADFNFTYHIDMVPIPKHIWKELPALCLPEDISIYKYLRDLQFTAQPLTARDERLKNIPAQYRENALLHILAKQRSGNILELWENYRTEHYYKELIELYPKTYTHIRNNFMSALQSLQESGLMTIKKENNFWGITPQGEEQHNEILKQRLSIIEEGFPL
jgi:hypothetical protein